MECQVKPTPEKLTDVALNWGSFVRLLKRLPKKVALGQPKAKLMQRLIKNYSIYSSEELNHAVAILLEIATQRNQIVSESENGKTEHPGSRKLRDNNATNRVGLGGSPRKELDGSIGLTESCQKDIDTRREPGEEEAFLSFLYERGYGLEKDKEKAEYFLRQAVERGSAVAMSIRAGKLLDDAKKLKSTLLNLGDPENKKAEIASMTEKGIALLRIASGFGDPLAMVRLALLLEEGTQGKPDFHKARDLYERASSLGYVDGDYNLALLYEGGLLGTQDDAKACHYYKLAAAVGHPAAQSNLGVMYEKGRGVERNAQKAFELYTKAAAQRHVLGYYNLALMYEKAKGGVVAKNERKAFKLFKKSASQGYQEGEIKVGYMYAIGRGVQPDLQKACEWYKRAALKNEVFACSNLGSMYLKGKGVPEDFATAYQLLKIAAVKGHPRARQWLARNPVRPREK